MLSTTQSQTANVPVRPASPGNQKPSGYTRLRSRNLRGNRSNRPVIKWSEHVTYIRGNRSNKPITARAESVTPTAGVGVTDRRASECYTCYTKIFLRCNGKTPYKSRMLPQLYLLPH